MLRDIAHVGPIELLTPVLDETARFFVEQMGLRSSSARPTRSSCARGTTTSASRSGSWAAQPGIGRTWLRASSEAALERRVRAVRAAGLRRAWLDPVDGLGRVFAFDGPGGHAFGLYCGRGWHRPGPGCRPALKNQASPFPGRGANLRRLDHVNFLSPDVAADSEFAATVLGARSHRAIVLDDGSLSAIWYHVTDKSYDLVWTSDWTGSRARLHHVAFAVDTRDDILRAADVCLEAGIHIETGPHKHAVQQTFFLYVWEPGGNRIELCNAGARLVLAPTGRSSPGRLPNGLVARHGASRRSRPSTPTARRRCPPAETVAIDDRRRRRADHQVRGPARPRRGRGAGDPGDGLHPRLPDGHHPTGVHRASRRARRGDPRRSWSHGACVPRSASGTCRGASRRCSLAAIASNATMNLTLFLAFGAMTVPLVMAVYYTYPVLVAVAAIALGLERARPSRIAALALATAGLVLVLAVEIGPDASVSAPGIALGFVAAACQATYFLVSRRGYDAVPPEQATSLILAGGAVLSGLMALTVGGGIGDAGWLRSPEAWLAILWAGTVGAAVAKVLLLVGIRRIGSTRAAVVMLAEPVIGVALAVVVLAQPLAPQQVVGGIAILVAAWIVQRPSGRPVPDTAPAPVAVASD